MVSLTKVAFRPLAPNSGGTGTPSPPELGDLGGILGFMQASKRTQPQKSSRVRHDAPYKFSQNPLKLLQAQVY